MFHLSVGDSTCSICGFQVCGWCCDVQGKDEEVADLEALDVGLRVLLQALVFSTRRRGGVYLWCSDFNRNPHSFECIVKLKKIPLGHGVILSCLLGWVPEMKAVKVCLAALAPIDWQPLNRVEVGR